MEYSSTTKYVNCKAFSGLIPKEGEELMCELIRSTKEDIYNPAKIRVFNYEMVQQGTKIFLHINPIGNLRQW